MTARNDLGKILKQRRLMIPLILSELAVASGVSPSHLGRIERGERFPSPLPESESQGEYNVGRLNPYVAAVLSREPVEIQRAVVATLSILTSIARGYRVTNG